MNWESCAEYTKISQRVWHDFSKFSKKKVSDELASTSHCYYSNFMNTLYKQISYVVTHLHFFLFSCDSKKLNYSELKLRVNGTTWINNFLKMRWLAWENFLYTPLFYNIEEERLCSTTKTQEISYHGHTYVYRWLTFEQRI